ncbi:relaxase/mobilization nuclease domain-containing protein [[Clostridium] innocuum]
MDNVIKYVEDEKKTMQTVLDYISQDNKVKQKKYVTCLNCDAFNPLKSMQMTKKLFHDHKRIVAFHGYQSFKIDEVDANIAHEIGVKLAQKVFGNRFEVIVTTHLDKDHIHNHILINSTSFVDGKRFCNTKKDYWNMRNASDELCKEYGLSIIVDPSYDSKKMNYHVMKTYMNDIKKDIDALIRESNCIKDLKDNMKKKGYEFDRIDEIDVIYHPYCNEPIYLKSLGERYHLDEIEERLTDKWILPQNVEHTKSYYQCKEYYQLHRRKKLPKLAGIHVAYLISINILPTRKQHISKEARQALKKMDQYSREIELLAKNKIEDIGQLNNYQQQKQDELNDLLKQRQGCYYQRQRARTMDEKEEWSARAKLFTPEIKKLRLQIKACENIRNRSFDKDIERIAQKKIKQRDAR